LCQTDSQTCCNGTKNVSTEECPSGKQCTASGTTSLCCPPGYKADTWSCPFGTDFATTCCKRSGFGQYETVPKISCDNNTDGSTQNLIDLCQYSNSSDCVSCASGNGIWTAIGCIPTTLDGFLQKILPFGMGIAGGIAFLLILIGGLQIMMSAGNPEKLNAGKELVSSAVAGLFLIIFSMFILRTIGADILGIPGFK